MRPAALLLVCLAALGCRNSTGPEGPPGPQGAIGAPGAQGPQGPQGPPGDKGEPGQVLVVDGGVLTGPPGQSVTVSPAPDGGCPAGGWKLTNPDGGIALVCNGVAGAMGPPGQTGSTGPIGTPGAQGATGPQGPPGSSVTVTALGSGNASCPYGGARLDVGGSSAYVCSGPPGPSGGSTFVDGGIPPVTFAGFTPSSTGGNLGGRTGAHALCNAAFAGSHFCTTWEYDQATPPSPAPTGGAWIDFGNGDETTRFFRFNYTVSGTSDCGGWTTSSPTAKPDGLNLGRGQIVTPLGGLADSWVSSSNGGCGDARPLACCRGGTLTRFRGYTPTLYGGNLGGRSGAHALCSVAFPGSHFCTTWEYDQAAPPSPAPTGGAWIDFGNGTSSTRFHRYNYAVSGTSDCGGWTTSSPTAKPDGLNLGRGQIVTPLGGLADSWVSSANGGCGDVRPLSCCQ